MKPEEVKFLADSIIDLLPDDPRMALTVIAITFASVVVSTRCPESDAHEALRRALRQMSRADRSRTPTRGTA
jgi:hypothetical protein